jgi:chromate reductase, NAD(P)H dehydrogenase (quinone)
LHRRPIRCILWDVEKPIKVPIILGSVRPKNYTAMAAALVADELQKDPKIAIEIIDPADLHLPLPGMDSNSAGAKKLQEIVKNATAVVLATPEYHGSFSSVMKLVIENLGFPSALRGKPVALLGVAAGVIGAIKSLEHLRGVVSHIGGIALPLPISIPHVTEVFDTEGRVLKPEAEKQIRSLATELVNYLEHAVCPKVALEALLRGAAA